MTDVVIIILNLNQLERTRECLNALFDAHTTDCLAGERGPLNWDP